MGNRQPAIDGHILVVDGSRMDVRSIRQQLQHIGCIFHTTESHGGAIQWLGTDSHIKVVVLDHGTANGRVADFVSELKSMRSNLTIVGSSSTDCRHEFAAAGVDRFLLKPWRIAELLEALTLPEPSHSKGLAEEASVDIHIGAADADIHSSDTDLDLGKAGSSDTACLRFDCGERVRIADGSLRGLKGTVVADRTGGRILLQLEEGTFVEIHHYCLEKDPSNA